jgi:dTDP-4-amino-4,6-dideoxygalactose transaminase
MIPFSPPRIDEKNIEAVIEVLKSGWITTGPKTQLFEQKIKTYTGAPEVLCLNSATAGLELVLRWFGVEKGDEVIVPAYTYAATANVVIHCGATPVFVDSAPDHYNLDIEQLESLITDKTKVIIPVDVGGFPCDYDKIFEIVTSEKQVKKFKPQTPEQEKLGRVLILSDAAHSLGAWYKGKRTGILADMTVFSFHAVKNLTTAEGGAICINLPSSFDPSEVYKHLRLLSLHGQSKDALAKLTGNWEYDILLPGYKYNMTDIQAAIGLVELERYDSDMLPRRKQIFSLYDLFLQQNSSIKTPLYKDEIRETSYHLYQIQIPGITEEKRNEYIKKIMDKGVSVNVHFKPLPMMSFYKTQGYQIQHYPNAYRLYAQEISLPVYYTLTDEQVSMVSETLNQVIP